MYISPLGLPPTPATDAWKKGVLWRLYFIKFASSAPLHGMEKICNVEISARISRLSSSKHEGRISVIARRAVVLDSKK
ncbi:hypothetical protein MTR_5g077340 [Medicago truncatula]|uniref:Uncharacterized protein n=1 Tax=Medicago truncatula TaxID=3880 RepID=G7KFX7_MEDTR|nr:hypothetical protein MTR_5g077340 [Medicago truncatula]